jgi:hypothetical protein
MLQLNDIENDSMLQRTDSIRMLLNCNYKSLLSLDLWNVF